MMLRFTIAPYGDPGALLIESRSVLAVLETMSEDNRQTAILYTTFGTNFLIYDDDREAGGKIERGRPDEDEWNYAGKE